MDVASHSVRMGCQVYIYLVLWSTHEAIRPSSTRYPIYPQILTISSSRLKMTDPPLGDVNPLKVLTAEEACTVLIPNRLNEFVPISTLPAEILEHIFNFCASWIYGSQKPRNCLAWTQVCFSWRKISLDSSRLWQRIDLCNYRYADQFLVRSKEAPLSVVSTSPLNLTTDNLTLHAGRIQSIDVFLFPDDMAHLFSSIGGGLTNLTHLSLKIPRISLALFLDIPLPRVRRLALDCIAVPWDNCRGLTHLSLRGLDPESCPSIPQLHQLFAQSPYIEFIRLENFVPRNLGSDDNLTQPLPLPHLKDIIMSSEPRMITDLLSGMLLSASTRLQLYFSIPENLSLKPIFPHGIPQTKNDHRLDISTVRLSRHSARFILDKTQSWSEDLSRSLFSISSASHIAIHICESIDHLLDVSRITNLELNTGVLFDITGHYMHCLLASLTNLEVLSIAFNDLEEILKALSAVQPPPVNLLCPRLVEISFSKPTDKWWQFGERWLDTIIDLARLRQHHSLPIHTMKFFKCDGISQSTAGRLQEVVPFVKILEFIAEGGYY